MNSSSNDNFQHGNQHITAMQNLEFIHQAKSEKSCTGLQFKIIEKDGVKQAKYRKVKSCKCVECRAKIDSYMEDLSNGIRVDCNEFNVNDYCTIEPVIDYDNIDNWHFKFVPIVVEES